MRNGSVLDKLDGDFIRLFVFGDVHLFWRHSHHLRLAEGGLLPVGGRLIRLFRNCGCSCCQGKHLAHSFEVELALIVILIVSPLLLLLLLLVVCSIINKDEPLSLFFGVEVGTLLIVLTSGSRSMNIW